MENLDRIEAYLNGEMGPDQKRAFEQEMSENPDLKAEVDIEQTLRDGIFAANLREELQTLAQEEGTPQRSGRIIGLGQWQGLAVAASVLLLVGFFFWWNSQKMDEGPTFADIYTQDPGLPVVMGQTEDSIFNEAMISYKEGEADLAQSTFEALCSNTGQDKSCYYLAQTLIGQEKYASAIIHLRKIAQDQSSALHQEAQWHLAFSLYKVGDEAYQRLLDDIAGESDHPYQDEALELISE